MTACASRSSSRLGSWQRMSASRWLFVCGVGVALAVAASGANAGTLVYGNLGASGTNSIGSASQDINGTSSPIYKTLGQGFTTGSSLLTIEKAELGIFVSPPGQSRTVSIWTDSSGTPGTKTFTSSAVNVTDGKMSFPFTGAALAANTSYWIIPDTQSGDTLSWYFNTTTPTGQNGSGYSFLGTKSLDTSNTWADYGFQGLSMSLTASDPSVIPEIDPNAIGGVMAFVTGALGWLERRRLARR